MNNNSIKNKTILGVGWSAVDAILNQGITFIVGIILARLLSPAEYGLIGIVTIFVTVLNGVVDSGFSTALIRKVNVSNQDYSTMFYTNLAFSIILYVTLFAASPLIADFFSRTELVNLTRVMGLLLIINALSITQITVLSKKLDFKTKTKASFIASIASGLVGIYLAYFGLGVWALVAQQISRQGLFSICLWSYNKWVPSFLFCRESFRYMWGFGWKMLVSGLINNIWNQLYQVVVGKFYSPSTLGQYTRSNEYANLLSSNLTGIVQRVSYPALSEIQDDKVRLVTAYRKVIKITMFCTTILMFAMGAVSRPLISTLIGEKWTEAAEYLPYICVSLSLYPLHALNLNMLQIQGRSDIFLNIEIAKKIIAIVPICLGIFIGIKSMLVGSIITGVIAFFINSHYTGKQLNYSSWMQLKDVSSSYFIAAIIAVVIYFFRFLSISNYVILLLQLFIGFLLFFSICILTKNEEFIELKNITQGIINKIRDK